MVLLSISLAIPQDALPVRLDPSLFPNSQTKWPQEVIGLGEVVGKLSADAAARLGLREGIPVAQGGADAFVGMGEFSRITPVYSSAARAP